MRIHVSFFLLPLLLLYSSPGYAQTPFVKAYQLPATAQPAAINTIYQEKSGYLLIGTSQGLFRFDGLNFTSLPAAQHVPADVTAILQARDGRIWVGFGDGKLGWLQSGRLVLQNPEEGLPGKAIKKIVEDSAGVIWIATAGEGIYYYKNKRFYNINSDDGLSDNYVYDIALSKDRIVAATDRGINFCHVQTDKKTVFSFTSRNGLPDNIVRSVRAVAGGFLVAMQDAGLGFLGTSLHFQPIGRGSTGQINDMVLQDNFVYLASEQQGLLQLQFGSDNRLLQQSAILPQKISALLQDAEGNIWAGGNQQLFRTNGPRLQSVLSLTRAESIGLHALLIDKNQHIWYNIPQGLKHLEQMPDGKWKERIYRLPVRINEQISALYEDIFENIWIGTMGSGVFLLDSKTGAFRKITETSSLINASVLSISGKDNQVWIASLEGAVRGELKDINRNIAGPVAMADVPLMKTLGTNYIYHIHIDNRNRVWFATDGKGIGVLDNNVIRSYNQQHGLKSEVIYQIAEDAAGHIWFTTFDAGLVRFDGSHFRHYTTADGLTTTNFTSLKADRNYIYLTHDKGIDKLNTTTGQVTYLDQEQGIRQVNTDLHTLTTAASGEVYFVADGAIHRYRDGGGPAAPVTVLDRIQLFLKDITVENGHVFSASEDNISFYYSGIYLSQPEKVQYQYQLQGFGNEWITTNDRRRDFPRLPPGTYTFRVRSSLNKNFDNASEASFTFTISKPIWMRWWFIVLLMGGAGLVLYYYIKAREKRLQKLERLEKEKIQSQFETLRNQVNPHFLFNSFNTLISEIEDDPKKAVEYVEQMADFFRNIVNYREKDVISLAEETGIISHYLFIQQKRYGAAFQVAINISDTDKERYMLAPLTLQLLAENAIKHNMLLRDKPLVLEIYTEEGALVVRNNIQPRLQPEKSAGLGLQNIQRRYLLLTGKKVAITNDGLYFTVIIPLIPNKDETSAHRGR